MSKSARERLRRRLAPRITLEFRHKGAACPLCRYVFSNGFSTLSAPGKKGVLGEDETLTLCSRCRMLLAVPYAEHKPLRALTEVEIMMLSESDRAAMAELTELFNLNRWD